LTSDDLDRVERELGVRLPAAYRALIQAYPVGLGSSGPDYELIDDADQLIAINRYFREHGFFGQTWPVGPRWTTGLSNGSGRRGNGRPRNASERSAGRRSPGGGSGSCWRRSRYRRAARLH
jgi:hypothetical protein